MLIILSFAVSPQYSQAGITRSPEKNTGPTTDIIFEEQISLIELNLGLDKFREARLHSNFLGKLLKATLEEIEDIWVDGKDEGLSTLEEGEGDVSIQSSVLSEVVKSRALSAIGNYNLVVEDYDKSRPYFQQAFELARNSGLKGEALSKIFVPPLQGLIRSNIGKSPFDDNLVQGCIPGKKIEGKVRALLLGVSQYDKNSDLQGPANDVALIKAALLAQGVDQKNIVSSNVRRVTRQDAIKMMKKLVRKTGCGDFVLFSFSGLPLSRNNYVSGDYRLSVPKGWESALAFSDMDYLNEEPDKGLIWGIELAEFVTALRNRGANVLTILDTGQATGLGVQHFQELARGKLRWRTKVILGAARLRSSSQGSTFLTSLNPGAGEFSSFYAADIGEKAIDKAIGDDGVKYGLFSYAFATTLQDANKISIEKLAGKIARTIGQSGRKDAPAPVFEASSADMVVLEAVGGGKNANTKGRIKNTGGLTIEITQPKLTRGVFQLPDNAPQKIEIIGRVHPVNALQGLYVDSNKVEPNYAGRFRYEVDLKKGKKEVPILAIANTGSFEKKVLRFDPGTLSEQLTKTGKRYALIIGNKNYKDENITDLVTPHADAEDLAKLLREKFGFLTEIEKKDGSKMSLLLLDATRSDFKRAFKQLKRLSKDDMLMIYYAGHGKLIKGDGGNITGAYWIPVDGEADDDGDWVSAHRVTQVIRQIDANHILVIADSCYSGAFTRDPVDISAYKNLPEMHPARQSLLKNMNDRKSRMIMSSGGEEPVLDSGCSGHSIFSCALLEGLKKIDRKVFSANELYNRYIYRRVGGEAKQLPQHKEIRESGHDGGGFLFATSQ